MTSLLRYKKGFRNIEHFEPLKVYLTLKLHEDPSTTLESMISTMNIKISFIYLEFMSCVLGILTDFNVMFQSETPLLFKLKPEITKIVRDLCSNFLKIEYVRQNPALKLEQANPRKFL